MISPPSSSLSDSSFSVFLFVCGRSTDCVIKVESFDQGSIAIKKTAGFSLSLFVYERSTDCAIKVEFFDQGSITIKKNRWGNVHDHWTVEIQIIAIALFTFSCLKRMPVLNGFSKAWHLSIARTIKTKEETRTIKPIDAMHQPTCTIKLL